MPDFTGFKDVVLINGKTDLPTGSSVTKIPQDNQTIFEYSNNPNPPSTSNISKEIFNKIEEINFNAAFQSFDPIKYSAIISKETVEDAQPIEIPYRSSEANIMNRVWVAYNFDGDIELAAPFYRACAFGGESAAFTWFDFVQGVSAAFEGYNPAGQGNLHPWSVRAWYIWGARNFELHSPFGRPYIPLVNPVFQNYEHLSYQADSFVCARDGWSDLGIQWGNPMPWLTNDFVPVWKALITGKQGSLTNNQWQELTQWFDPNDPIKVLAYNGTISRISDQVENQYPRWNRLFAEDPKQALNRLQESVDPFIECGMSIGLDALTTNPGSQVGAYIPTNLLSKEAQAGWWTFFTGLVNTVGFDRLYCEAQPHRKTRIDNGRIEPSPYLGMNVISGEDWSYYPDPSKHDYSELGKVKFMRNYRWGGKGPKTKRYNDNLSPARYPDLYQYSSIDPEDGEARVPLVGGATYMGALEHLQIFAARNLIDGYQQFKDSGINKTIPEFMMPHDALQVFPSNWVPSGQQRFIDRFPTGASFKAYLDGYKTPYLPVFVLETQQVGQTAV